jgi:phthiocerol/phenolphthiocerol synthesis type-I polyketide synthase E
MSKPTALKLAFNTHKKHFCGIGSVKTNIGHLDTAAGAAGLIKTVLALKHCLIPPSLHFHAPNPKLDLENSPFYVVSKLTPWQTVGNQPRRAGVSSLGIGGTNAHVIVEEAPLEDETRPAQQQYRLILLSARTPNGLAQARQNLAKQLESNPQIDLCNMAYTLQVGRRTFEYRQMTVCQDIPAVLENLASDVPDKAPAAFCPGTSRGKIVFLFPGQGSQYVNMGLGLYETQPVFRQELDRCFKILDPLVGYDIKQVLYPSIEDHESNGSDRTNIINQTQIAQPLLFSIQYALVKLLLHWGIRPDAMMGHSIGEYAAAHLAGVFSLEDALKLVAARGRLMQGLPRGAMLGVPLSEDELAPMMEEYRDISIAAVNNKSRCVVSGPADAIDVFETALKEKGCNTRRLHTSHAFHSQMMDPILMEFEEEVRRISPAKPTIPYISNLSGNWIKDGDVVEPVYWSRHLRRTVRFSHGLDVLMREDKAIFVEVGPGRTLTTMVKGHEARKTAHSAVTLMRHPEENIPDDLFLLNGIGQLWLSGADIRWSDLYTGEKVSRISLPGYPFEKVRCMLDKSLLKKAAAVLAVLADSPQEQEPDAANTFNAASECSSPAESGPLNGFIPQQVQSPRNEFEKKIAIIWQEVLGFEQVGIYNNFFDLNGDSLSATQVISRVKDTFKVDVPLKVFFAEPTVAQLASMVKTLLVEKIKNLSPEEKKKLAGG